VGRQRPACGICSTIPTLTSYVFLGALAGAIGQVICTSQGMTVPVIDGGGLDLGQRILAIRRRLLMIAMALQFFGRLTGPASDHHRLFRSSFAAVLRSLLTVRGPGRRSRSGVFNGFLPCRWSTPS